MTARNVKKRHTNEPELTADQPRKKQGLFHSRIKFARNHRISRSSASCRSEASTRKCLEAALGLQEGLCVLRIEGMPGIAVVVHDDLGCHRHAPSVGGQIKTILLMLYRKKSSASTILTGKAEREIASGVISPPVAHARRGIKLLLLGRST